MNNKYYNDIFTRISIKKRDKIMDVATREFATKGFDSANISDIAREGGVSVGALYKYFGNKKNLFLACVDQGLETLEKILGDVLISGDDFFSKVEKVIRIIQEYARSHRHMIILYNEMTAERNAEFTWEMAAKMEAISAKVYTLLIAQAQEQKLVRTDIAPSFLAFFLDNLFMMLHFSYACGYYRERFKIYVGENFLDEDEALVEALLSFIKKALKD